MMVSDGITKDGLYEHKIYPCVICSFPEILHAENVKGLSERQWS